MALAAPAPFEFPAGDMTADYILDYGHCRDYLIVRMHIHREDWKAAIRVHDDGRIDKPVYLRRTSGHAQDWSTTPNFVAIPDRVKGDIDTILYWLRKEIAS